MSSSDGSRPPLELDRAFDQAFTYLAECRIAYEDNPRDPQRIELLGAARASLEDARTAMNDERVRLGLEPRQVAIKPAMKIDGDARGGWQGIQPN